MQNDKESSFYAIDMTILAFEQTNKRMFMLCVLLIVLLLGTNIGWLIYENQFEDVVTTVTQEATTNDNSDVSLSNIGGDYYGGESETNGIN